MLKLKTNNKYYVYVNIWKFKIPLNGGILEKFIHLFIISKFNFIILIDDYNFNDISSNFFYDEKKETAGNIKRSGWYDYYYENEKFFIVEVDEEINYTEYKISNIKINFNNDLNKISIFFDTTDDWKIFVECWAHYTDDYNDNFLCYIYILPKGGRYNITYASKINLIKIVKENINNKMVIEIICEESEYSSKKKKLKNIIE